MATLEINSEIGHHINLYLKKMQRTQTLPLICMETIFSFLEPKDLFTCMLVCRHWNSIIHGKGKYVWRAMISKVIPKAALDDAKLKEIFPNAKNLFKSFMYAWNPNDISSTMYVKSDCFTVYRKPIAQCTDAVRGKRPVTSGVHAFDYIWHSPFGTTAVVGFGTINERLQCPGYESLIGKTDQSWGWNLVDHQLLHKNRHQPYPANTNMQNTVQTNSRIRLIIDCDRKMAGFEMGDEFLGVAFKKLPSVALYPMVAAVYGHSEISMYYMGLAELG